MSRVRVRDLLLSFLVDRPRLGVGWLEWWRLAREQLREMSGEYEFEEHSGDLMRHVNIAADTNASSEILDGLSTSPESVVRMQVALNPNTRTSTLYRLTGDPNAEVAVEATSQLSKGEHASSPDQLDEARVGFFDLEAGERPIEAAGVNAWAGWPVTIGNPIPIPPESASDIQVIGGGFTDIDPFSISFGAPADLFTASLVSTSNIQRGPRLRTSDGPPTGRRRPA